MDKQRLSICLSVCLSVYLSIYLSRIVIACFLRGNLNLLFSCIFLVVFILLFLFCDWFILLGRVDPMRDDLDIVSSEIFRSSGKKQFGENLATVFRGTC